MTEKRILIVEDNLEIAETIKLYLTHAKFSFIHLNKGEFVTSTIKSHSIHLVLLDLMLPDTDGVSLCKDIRKISKVPIMMITAKTQESDIVQGLNAGADDYLCKPFRPNELIARIKSLLRRTADFNETKQLVFDDLVLDINSRKLTINDQGVNLTKSEYVILEYLLKKQGTIVTRGQIIEQAFDHTYSGSDRAIDSQLYNLRKKINHQRQYIETVYGVGYTMGLEHQENRK